MAFSLLRTKTPAQNLWKSLASSQRLSSGQASSSSSPPLTHIAMDEKTKIATLTLSRLPANALSLELMQQIRRDIEQLQAPATGCRGVVLTSASQRIFCAGLDLREVHRSDREHLTVFWRALQDLWRTLFSTPLPVAALINGHAVAGGCMMSTCCDYRVMLPNLIIGLNETKAGVAAPKYVIDAYVNVLGNRRRAEADLIGGLVYSSEEALKVGLVDAVAATKEAAMAKCLEFFAGYKGVNDTARALTKLQFRREFIDDFERHRERDLEIALQALLSPEFKTYLGDYLQSLSKGKKQN